MFSLLTSIGVNLIVLCYFKYPPFFSEFFSHTLNIKVAAIDGIDLSLPLGVSFFTFTQIAYLIDIYQNQANQSDVISYGLFVSIFPHLITTPVIQPKNMMEQFSQLHTMSWSYKNLAEGIFLFIIGLSKKVLIADSLMGFVQPVFDHGTSAPQFFQAWFAALAYTIELYFDFSGYLDMAVGLGLMFNIHLAINFNSPYQATSIIDFWRRWHHSLSSFLRDYLYMPISGSENCGWNKLRNLLFTIILGCFWHGAGLTFILWGAAHGLLLLINRFWVSFGINMPNWLARSLTLLSIITTWVIFRSADLTTAFGILQGMSGVNGFFLTESFPYYIHEILWVLALYLAVSLLPNSKYWKSKFQEKVWIWAPGCSFLFVINILNLKEVTTFLYYQF